jgi:hypothetical protein
VKHDITAAGWQGKCDQMYIKNKYGHSILLDIIMFWTK